MIHSSFTERLRYAQSVSNSLVCVGLDPDPEKLPKFLLRQHTSAASSVLAFNQAIIEATAPYACAYKLNAAFYENLGSEGFDVLRATVRLIPEHLLSLIDAKRGDIGNTANQYASSIFDLLRADACTVAPYMGADAVTPFLRYEGCAAFVLIRTSNPNSDQLQSLMINGAPLYEHVARLASDWSAGCPGSIGFVVGATNPHELHQLRAQHPEVPFLIPGIGAQGGSIQAAASAATSKGLVLINSSRGILYASSGSDFDQRAAAATQQLRDALNEAIQHPDAD